MSPQSHVFRSRLASLLVGAARLAGVASADDVPVAQPVPLAVAVAEPVAKPSARPLSITVTLLSNTVLSGTLTDTREVNMKTSFGEAIIPLSEVAGIRLASTDDSMTTVVMLNGDSITGATDIQKLIVETEWGTATINGTSVGSVLFVPGLTWNSLTGLNGKRWSLVDVKKDASPAPNPTSTIGTSSPQIFDSSGRLIDSSGRIIDQSGTRFPNGSFSQPQVIRSR